MPSVMTEPYQTLTSVEATLNYAGPTNGKPYFGLEAYESNIAFEPHQVLIYDARPIQNQFSRDRKALSSSNMPAPQQRIHESGPRT